MQQLQSALVCKSCLHLATFADLQASAWQPRTWVEMMQIVVSFLMQLMSRSSGSSAEKLGHMQCHIAELQQAYRMFTIRRSAAGESTLSSSLSRLSR